MVFCQDYEFIETAKSKSNRSENGSNLGILVTQKCMIYWITSYNADKSKVYYRCSMKRDTGCTASAIVDKIEIPNDKTGEVEVRYVLTSCASIDQHNHEGDFAQVVSERMQMEMAQKVEVRYF